MDSIGDNVMAIICVVVGVLIIGCALVPIVENASVVETETITYQDVSGYNTLSSGAWIGPLDDTTMVSANGTITIDSETVATAPIIYSGIGGPSWVFANPSNGNIVLYPALTGEADNVRLYSGTIAYTSGTLTITGMTADSTEYTTTVQADNLYVNAEEGYADADETQIYGVMNSTFIMGKDQYCVKNGGGIIANGDDTELPDGLTFTDNGNETVTVTITSGTWYGPYKWTGTETITETTTSDSEYKDLYNIIPVLCILGMAYVLIRRFY